MALNIYLNFNGNCDAAFRFYKEVFGGEFITYMTFGDVPGDQPVSDADKNKLMHVSLAVGTGHLMGSDMPGYLPKATIGDNFSISHSVATQEEADRVYTALSAGGKATMPMQKTFWSPWFGMLTDRFGIQWMIGLEGQPEA